MGKPSDQLWKELDALGEEEEASRRRRVEQGGCENCRTLEAEIQDLKSQFIDIVGAESRERVATLRINRDHLMTMIRLIVEDAERIEHERNAMRQAVHEFAARITALETERDQLNTRIFALESVKMHRP